MSTINMVVGDEEILNGVKQTLTGAPVVLKETQTALAKVQDTMDTFQRVGERADQLFDSVNRFIQVWGKRVIVTLLIALGAVMVADGVGWLFGHPLIPVV